MTRIFLSHSESDTRAAVALKGWLIEQDPPLANEVFLDVDPAVGLTPGTRWKTELFRQNSRCEAVICLLSQDWLASTECRTEFRTAENLGKQIIIARLEDTAETGLTAEWHRCDLFGEDAMTEIDVAGGPRVALLTAGLYRLRDAIRGAGIGAEYFVWPPINEPDRAPYRGWEPFEEVDAGVFFGRDAAIVRGLDELRAMRQDAVKSLFVVLGPSGSGKSSFLRSGLLPRLRREDTRFLPLGIVRPQRNALTGDSGLAVAIHAARHTLRMPGVPLGELKAACMTDGQRVAALLRDVRDTAAARMADGHDGPAPTLVLPLDQAEELFSADAGPEAEVLLALISELTAALNISESALIVAASIRTDRYEAMQNHPSLAAVSTVVFDELKPMPATQFRQVITGPAERTADSEQPIRVSPVLVDRLLADATEGADTLPLLSLTLARLYTDYGSTGELTREHYEAIGGMRDVVDNEIDTILSRDPDERAHQLGLLRSAFIPWLATVNPDTDQPLRRVARFGDLPEAAHRLIDAMVAKRLIVKTGRSGDVVVEVALESLLRQWEVLAGWLREQRQNLITADDAVRNARAWRAAGENRSWLLTGSRLSDAEALADSEDFAGLLGGSGDYLHASRAAEDERREAEEQYRNAEVRAAEERQQTAEAHTEVLRKRARALRLVLAGTAVIAVLALVAALFAYNSNQQARQQLREATVAKLVSEGEAILAGTTPGGDQRAIQELLAARAIGGPAQDPAILGAQIDRFTTERIVDTGSIVHKVAYSRDGARIATAQADHTVRLWRASNGDPVGQPLNGHSDVVAGVVFTPDATTIASAGFDGTMRLWRADTGEALNPNPARVAGLTTLTTSPDGRLVITGGSGGIVQIWNPTNGDLLTTNRPFDAKATVSDVAFDAAGDLFAASADDGTIVIFDRATGNPRTATINVKGLTGQSDTVWGIAFSPDGHTIAAGSDTLQLFNADTGALIRSIALGTSRASQADAVAFSPDGRRLVSGRNDGAVQLWDAGTGAQIGQTMLGHTAGVTGVEFSPDGAQIASTSIDGTLRLWSGLVGQPMRGPDSPVEQLGFSPDGRRVAEAGDTAVQQWDVHSGAPTPALPIGGVHGGASEFAFTGADAISTVSADGTVQKWDATTAVPAGPPSHVAMPAGHVRVVLAFSRDGRQLAIGDGSDASIQLWDADAGQRSGPALTVDVAGKAYIFGLAFSPDGRRLAASYGDGVRTWNTSTTQLQGTLMAAPTSATSVAYSADGSTIAAGNVSGDLQLWDTAGHQRPHSPLRGHTSGVFATAFGPGGQLVTGSEDGAVWLWDTATGTPAAAPLRQQTDAVLSVAISPDGRLGASGGFDGNVYLWPARADPDQLCAKLSKNITRADWSAWISPAIPYQTLCKNLPPADR